MFNSCVSEANNSSNILPTLPQIYKLYGYLHTHIHTYMIIKI